MILYDNAKTIVVERDTYGDGQHRWHAGRLDLVKRYSFRPRLCQRYRAQTKGKIERFHRYLYGSLYVSIANQLNQSGMVLDAETANVEVRTWLREVANQRVPGYPTCARNSVGTTRSGPLARYAWFRGPRLPAHAAARLPVSPAMSIQHPLSVYQQLLTEVRA